jgi:hypothetical protein
MQLSGQQPADVGVDSSVALAAAVAVDEASRCEPARR